MTAKLFTALYAGLIVGMFTLFIFNFLVGWIFYIFVFVTVFGGLLLFGHSRLIASFFLAPSLIVLGIGLYAMQRPWETRTWPTANAVVTRAWACGHGKCIEYRYKVDGEPYQAESTDIDPNAPSAEESVRAGYQTGQEMVIYYDRHNPGISRLTADILPRDWITAGIGAIMTGLSAFTLITLQWKLTRPAPKKPR